MPGTERPRISLRQIEGFQLASEHLSFCRAAAQLGISQSAFSQLIRELEAQLGVDLFDRTTRKVVLTAAGEAMKLKTRRGLDAIDDGCKEAIAVGRADRGHFRVGALSSLAMGIVTRTLGRPRTDFPSITASPQEGGNDALVDLIGTAAVDLAVSSQAEGTREHASAALEAHGVATRVNVEVSSMATAVAMVRASFGSAFVSRLGLQDLSTDGVRIIPIAQPATRPIGIYRRADRQPAIATVKFIQLQAWRL